MREFEFFLNEGSVKKIVPDNSLIKSLLKDAFERLAFYKKFDISKETAKFIFENVYDSLRESADAVLIKDGYKSYSHEASIIYLLKYDISLVEINKFNRFRIIRNNSKYYGKPIDIEDVKDALELAESLLNKIKHILKL